MLVLIDVALVVLALYLIQEGRAQQANPHLHFFVRFPGGLLPLAYLAILVLVPNFAVTFFSLLRGLPKRLWPWLTTAVAVILLGIIVTKLGLGGTWVIIHPAAAR